MNPLARPKYLTVDQVERLKTALLIFWQPYKTEYRTAFKNGTSTQYQFGLHNAIYFCYLYIKNNAINLTIASVLADNQSMLTRLGTRLISDHPDDVSDRDRLSGMAEGYRLVSQFLRSYVA
jgi:hypothetical protein